MVPRLNINHLLSYRYGARHASVFVFSGLGGHAERFATDLDFKLNEDTGLLTENIFLGLKPVCLAYCAWGGTGRELTIPVESFLDPLAVRFVLGRVEKTN